MRSRFYKILFFVFFLFAGSIAASAQLVIKGTVILADNSEIELQDLKVFSFSTKADARKGLAALVAGKFKDNALKYATRGQLGKEDNWTATFSIDLADTPDATALFWHDGYEAVFKDKKTMSPGMQIILEDIQEAPTSIDSVQKIRNVTITDTYIGGQVKGTSETIEEDGLMTSKSSFEVPFRLTSNMRVVAQPVWYDRVDVANKELDKVFSFGSVVFSDEEEYAVSQKRRMDFDLNNDSLHYADINSKRFIIYDTLRAEDGSVVGVSERKSEIKLHHSNDTILVNLIDTVSGFDPDPSHAYPFGAIVQVLDYNTVLYSDVKIDNGERRSPLKFLELRLSGFEPDADFFFEEMSNTRNEQKGELRLNFLVGRSTIDSRDTTNIAQLNKLYDLLGEIQRDSENRALLFVDIYGMASPEGNLETNKALARSRAEYTANQVRRFTNRPINIRDSRVAPWSAVADTIARDGYNAVAEEMRAIIEKYPDNIQLQGRHIANLDAYPMIKDKYLSLFRTVRYVVVENKIGKKEPARILRDYRKNPNNLSRAEYWALIQHVKDDKAMLREVAANALKYTQIDEYSEEPFNNYGYWAYPAGLLASCCVDADTIDFSILEPFLELKNQSQSSDSISMLQFLHFKEGSTVIRYFNSPEFAANQLIMTLRQNNRVRRELIPQLELLITKKGLAYDTLLAVSKCMRGKYRGDSDEASEIRRKVSSVSVTNAVILNLARANAADVNDAYLNMAVIDSVNLPNNAVSDYLKSVMCLRKNSQDLAEYYLASSYCKDYKMIAISNNDKDLLSEIKSDYHVSASALNLWRTNIGDYVKETNRRYITKTEVVPADSISAKMGLAADSVRTYTEVVEMSDEDYQKNIFVRYVNAFEKLIDKRDSNDADAIETLYSIFDTDKEFLSIFNVLIIRTPTILNDKKLKDKVMNVRNEYIQRDK